MRKNMKILGNKCAKISTKLLIAVRDLFWNYHEFISNANLIIIMILMRGELNMRVGCTRVVNGFSRF